MSQHRYRTAVTISQIDRLTNSRSGNPRYKLSFDHGESFNTAADTDYAFDIGNPGYRVGDSVDIDINGRGTISKIEKGDPQAYVLVEIDLEEKASRATGVLGVYMSADAADEARCYYWIGLAEDELDQLEDEDGEKPTFYELLDEVISYEVVLDIEKATFHA